jgi:glycosyltransferase involved in cell wall biosynthesis
MTDPLGESQVLPYLKALSNLGHQIHLLSFEKKEVFASRKEVIRNICESSGINWIPKTYSKRPPILSTLKDIVVMSRTAFRLNKQIDFDIVHCRSYIAAIVGRSLQKRSGLKFLFDMRGFWADERIDGKIWSKDSFIHRQMYQYFKKRERDFLIHADRIVSLTFKGKEIIEDWLAGWQQAVKGKIYVIPCCTDLQLFDYNRLDPEERSAIRTKHKLTNRFVLCYLGSIGTWYMLPEMLDFYACMRKALKNESTFLFISRHSRQELIEQAIERGIPEDEILALPAKREEVPGMLNAADAGVFFIKPLFSKNASSPVKHGEMLGVGLPVVSNSGVGDMDLFSMDSSAGVVVSSFDNDSYLEAINTLTESTFDKAHLRKVARENYALESGISTYADIYKELN